MVSSLVSLLVFAITLIWSSTGHGAICSSDEWCWENPLPQGNNLRAVWSSSGSNVFAVGEAGTVLHYDGSTWSSMTSGTTSGLHGIWGSSASDIFAVGESGTILHYDGSSWSAMTSGTTQSFLAVWGSSSNDVFAVGYSGAIYHYNGSGWSAMTSGTAQHLFGLWGSSSSDVFAVGFNGAILHYDGSNWLAMTSNTTQRLYAVWGSGSSDVFAVGYSGAIFHYDGSNWSSMPGGNGEIFFGVWGSSGNDVYAISSDGAILHYDGSIWSTVASGTGGSSGLFGIWGSSDSDVFAVGYSGTTFHYDGSNWSLTSTGTARRLRGIWGSSDSDVFAVGYLGTILHNDGNNWSIMASGNGSYLYLQGIWGSSGSDIFAVGDTGTILHYNGSIWSTMTSGTTANLQGIWGSSGSDVFAVGDSGTILHYNGSSWSTMNSNTTVNLQGIWGSSTGGDVFAVGDSGTIIHYDGSTWSVMTSGISQPLHAIWGSSGGDVFAVGRYSILHYDGSTWSAMTGIGGELLYGIWGSSGSDIFAVGYSNDTYTAAILHYNGSSWSAMDSGTVWSLQSIWGSNDVFTAGDSGAILRRLMNTTTHTVTASAGANGSLDAGTPSPQSVLHGSTTDFTFNADSNYHVAAITGCGIAYNNSDSGVTSHTATTDQITSDCAVSATFGLNSYTVNGSVDTHGQLDVTSVAVNHGSTAAFTVTPDTGYIADVGVGGDCSTGSWSGLTYTTGTVTDNCSVSFTHSLVSVSLSLANSPLAENNGAATVTATLSAITTQDVTVNLSFTGTASTGDYTRSIENIVILAGDLSADTTLTGIDDTVYDPAETIIVDITSVTNGSENGTQQVTAIITDDEPEPTVSLSLAGNPINENGGIATVTATLSGLSGQDVTVNMALSGSASGADYSTSANDIVILAGNLSGSMTLTGSNDSHYDPAETVIVDISNVVNASEDGVQQVTLLIADDEPEPTVSLSLLGSPFDENGGVGTVTATLSGLSDQDVTVNLDFSGTATAADYSSSSSSIVISALDSFSTITLTGTDDSLIDMDETVVVDILSVTNALEDAVQQVSAIITDDDLPLPNFTQFKKRLAQDGQLGDYFGYSVSISGDFAVVGAYGDDDNGGIAGSAYVFQNNLGGAYDDWAFVKKIKPSDGANGDEFGFSVSISGDTIVIGARSDLNSPGGWTGSAYVFRKDYGSPNSWGQVTKLVPQDGTDWDFFGRSVAIFGDTVIVGAYRDDDNGSDSGSAYVYQKNEGGLENWGQVKKITALDGAAYDEFGGTVAAGIDTVFIGAEGDDDNGSLSGSVYIFQKDLGGLNNWGLSKKIVPSDGVGGNIFSRSIAVTDATLVVGAANNSSAYIFQKDIGGTDNWGQLKKITPSGGSVNNGFGQSVSIHNHTLIVGAHGDDSNGVNAGAAYVFRSNNGGANNWGQVQKITASDGAAGDFFGYSVAISGNSFIAGAYADDDMGTDSGSAYIFADANGLPEVSLSLSAGNPIAEDGGIISIVATLSEMSAQDVTVYLTFSGTAVSSDFTFSSDHIVIPAGTLSGSITLTGIDDLIYDPDETIVVDISVLIAALEKGGFQQVVVTVTDDETPVTVTLGLSSSQFDENGGSTMITATLSGLVGQDVTVNLGLSGTASSADYTIPDSFIFIPTGELSATVTITGVDDTLVELGESLIIDIASVVHAAENGSQQVVAAINDDELVLANIQQFKKILAFNGTENDSFGYSVSISGDWAAIGASGYNNLKGAVYIFQKDEGGMDNWGLTKAIIPNNLSQELFGASVDITGNFLIIGEPENYTGDIYNRHGSAYIYQKDEGGAGNWGWVKTLNPPGLPSGDFGKMVSLSGDTAVIGSSYAVTGRIYSIFTQHQGGTNNWGFVKSIIIANGSDSSVSIDNDILVIGDQWDESNAPQEGSVYVFYKNQGGPDNWGQTKKLTASDGAEGDRFGNSVAISGSQVVIGAVGDENNAGSAYLFRKDHGGIDNWGEVAKIVSTGGNADEHFGSSVSLINDIAVIGKPGDGNGSAYVFQKDAGGLDSWGQVTKFTASDGAVDDNFGISVDVSLNTIIVGASSDDDKGDRSGSAYLFSFNVAGDVDHDGFVGLTDIIRALDVVAGGMPAVGLNGDINGDGRIGIADIIHILHQLAESP